MFRRDKDYWNYNLLANPLNPATGPIPGAAIVNSPQALDLSRKMQDYDLTLFPQSRLRFRVGYSRNADTGPASTTLEGGTEPLLSENVNEITNSYRLGVDYRGLPKTTLSFDELLTYTAINNTVTDNNFGFQLTNGTPVDLGIVSVGTTPCAPARTRPSPLRWSAPRATRICPYSQVQNPRSSFPVERFSFQSSYLKNLSMTSGSAELQRQQEHGHRISTRPSPAGPAGRSRAGARRADRRGPTGFPPAQIGPAIQRDRANWAWSTNFPTTI